LSETGIPTASVDWDAAAGERISTEDQRATYVKLMDTPGAIVARNDGDVAAAEKNGKQRLTAEFPFPYVAHVPMEPYNAVVELKDDGCELWLGTQWQGGDQIAVAQATGLKPEQVKINTMFVGGGFGRRTNPPIAVEAVEVAKAARAAGLKGPVKLVWTREDDVHGGYYRPFVHARLTATLDAAGRVTSWTDRHAAQSVVTGTPFEAVPVKNGVDTQNTEGAEDMPYAIPNVRFDIHQPKHDITCGGGDPSAIRSTPSSWRRSPMIARTPPARIRASSAAICCKASRATAGCWMPLPRPRAG
jgi:isoquinoline 1-oxidoreductase beta subunit